VGTSIGGQVGANIQKIFAYGLRNSFGMAFDPVSGNLWEEENGDDTFSELNRVEPGFNSGWVQIQGPPDRIAQYKAIETSLATDPLLGTVYFGLQQVRWPPTNIADSPEQALSRLFALPGAHYSAPEFAWKFEVAPAAIGFVHGRGLGSQFEGDLFTGGARTFLEGGHWFHFNLTGNRQEIGVDDSQLEDRVADNNHKFDITESESLLIGTNPQELIGRGPATWGSLHRLPAFPRVVPGGGAGGTPDRGAQAPTAAQAVEHLEPAPCPQGDPPQCQQHPHPRPHDISTSQAFIPGCRPGRAAVSRARDNRNRAVHTNLI
jgi:hypothetical protein